MKKIGFLLIAIDFIMFVRNGLTISSYRLNHFDFNSTDELSNMILVGMDEEFKEVTIFSNSFSGKF